ncbi:regulatory protein RecX [Polluticaenibacter yanchengensis]|uniref:Regulatory protein RecX n=1 Tax=Polluticaenibacter yanchengensis TaxID=3014562 RepID=A0ABT4UGJ5_9BACT|nr:regulatory protein RecX [Chitinophagaceae bacterium LY-5]
MKKNDNYSKLTPLAALDKLKHYCAYQERCHADVSNKLFGYGINSLEQGPIIAYLIEENYLNEERYATQFAGGHYRLKKWGRIKIVQALKQKQISEYLIKRALKEIDEDDYLETLHKLAEAKWPGIKAPSILHRRQKCKMYLMQKGYEPHLINEVIKQLE